jgi:hypothetical protein
MTGPTVSSGTEIFTRVRALMRDKISFFNVYPEVYCMVLVRYVTFYLGLTHSASLCIVPPSTSSLQED